MKKIALKLSFLFFLTFIFSTNISLARTPTKYGLFAYGGVSYGIVKVCQNGVVIDVGPPSPARVMLAKPTTQEKKWYKMTEPGQWVLGNAYEWGHCIILNKFGKDIGFDVPTALYIGSSLTAGEKKSEEKAAETTQTTQQTQTTNTQTTGTNNTGSSLTTGAENPANNQKVLDVINAGTPCQGAHCYASAATLYTKAGFSPQSVYQSSGYKVSGQYFNSFGTARMPVPGEMVDYRFYTSENVNDPFHSVIVYSNLGNGTYKVWDWRHDINSLRTVTFNLNNPGTYGFIGRIYVPR